MRIALEGHWSFPGTGALGEDDATPDAEARGRAKQANSNVARTKVSDSARDLITGALEVDCAARLSADALLKHEWLQRGNAVCPDPLPNSVVAAVRARSKHNKRLAAQHMKAWGSPPRGET